ncbi:hypothetical protein LEP1GSC125_0097 [Leptospira mayottensis 200901122]|uniref:Uncharacterized protein n=1 Tax=Leptospira mayottensis 200901122 TaxID=1193010 RepID=A0AA87SYL9_9LEPT|nr:hypothetical protein LEP1GSC125_0097 [Leptospira mayottensis 200901122]
MDLGYKGGDHHPDDVQVHLSNKSRKYMIRWQRMWMDRRFATFSKVKKDIISMHLIRCRL